MPSLNILLVSDDSERFRGALTLALSHVALNGQARLFLQLDAVRMLAPPIAGPLDSDYSSLGMPVLTALVDEALENGITIVACQSGLALAGLDASILDPRIEAGGPVSFLQAVQPEDRLLAL